MNENTINADVTMGGAAATLLAGRYRVVRQLGQGGMGSVWLAEDTKLDGLKVAVKLLPSVLVSNRRAYDQLKAEALVSLRLSHPNIATVRAFEENDGNPFLVMDYIDGMTLDEYLARKGALDEATTRALLEPVARALDYAHEKGVVHRDVKPGNVMITWDGEPFVLDFGIAREIQETMTRVTGKLSSGTLLYMSPEQLKGAAPKPAQDVYSFAAMAYECMRGEPPFPRGQVEWQILNQEPEPLSGGAFALSVMCGLAKDPSQRPKTCRGMFAVARPRPRPSFGSPHSEPPRRRMDLLNNKWLALALIVLSLVVIFLNVDFKSPGGGPIVPPPPPPPPPSTSNDVDHAVNAVRSKAMSKIDACRKLDAKDGFGERLAEQEKSFDRAEKECRLGRRDEALRIYREVVGRCDGLISLDADRVRARHAAEEMSRLAHEATKAEANFYAKELFGAATNLINEARDDFRAMRFADAAEKHSQAARQFERAAKEARTAKPPPVPTRKPELPPAPPLVSPPAPPPVSPKSPDGEKGEKTVLLPNNVPLEMVWCGAGTFVCRRWGMGMRLDMKGFWISKYELTQRQWKAVMDENPSAFREDDLPVEQVSWNACMRYLKSVNARGSTTFRLPTGDEWEYAALGGHKRSDKTASDKELKDICWCKENSGDRPHRGGGKSANALGLHDMIGNVWEWCADTGKGGDAAKREVHGGSYYNSDRRALAADGWKLIDQEIKADGVGLRLVCDEL